MEKRKSIKIDERDYKILERIKIIPEEPFQKVIRKLIDRAGLTEESTSL